jgi:hypothetical protein
VARVVIERKFKLLLLSAILQILVIHVDLVVFAAVLFHQIMFVSDCRPRSNAEKSDALKGAFSVLIMST